MLNDNTNPNSIKKNLSLQENPMSSYNNPTEGLHAHPSDSSNFKEKEEGVRSQYEATNFKESFNNLVEKIKKATAEELPDLEKSLMNLAKMKHEDIKGEVEPIQRKIKALKNCARDEMEQLRDVGDAYISYNPWKSVAVAGLVGVIVGATLCRDHS